MELYINTKDNRSVDQNHKKRKKSRDQNSGYFLGYFSDFFGGILGGGWTKSVRNLGLLIPYDVDLTTCLARSFTDSKRGEMNAKNGEKHGRKSGIQTHTTHTLVALVGAIHQLNRIHKGKAKDKVPWWMD